MANNYAFVVMLSGANDILKILKQKEESCEVWLKNNNLNIIKKKFHLNLLVNLSKKLPKMCEDVR